MLVVIERSFLCRQWSESRVRQGRSSNVQTRANTDLDSGSMIQDAEQKKDNKKFKIGSQLDVRCRGKGGLRAPGNQLHFYLEMLK